MAVLPGGGRDRPGAVGSRGPASRRARVAAARRARGRAGRGQLHDRRRRPRRRRGRRPARPGRRAFAASRRRSGSATTPAGSPRSGRLLGPDVAIRLDANGAWSVEEAVAALRALAPVGIELCEEPVRGLDADAAGGGRRRASRSRSTRPRPRSERSRTASAEAVCLKIARCGGITGVVAGGATGRAPSGYEVYLASTLDGPLGIAAALHAAAVVHPERAVRAGDAGAVRRPRGSAPGARRSDRGPGRARASATGSFRGTRWPIGAHVIEVTLGRSASGYQCEPKKFRLRTKGERLR